MLEQMQVAEAEQFFDELRNGIDADCPWEPGVNAVVQENLIRPVTLAAQELQRGELGAGLRHIAEMINAGMHIGFRLGKLAAAETPEEGE